MHSLINKHVKTYSYRTDHSFTAIEIDNHDLVRSKGFWKFNTSLLKDTSYVELIKSTIQNVKSEYSINENNQSLLSYQMFFEMLKLQIRGISIPYCSKKKRDMKLQEVQLEGRIQVWEGAVQYAKIDDSLHTELIANNIDRQKN